MNIFPIINAQQIATAMFALALSAQPNIVNADERASQLFYDDKSTSRKRVIQGVTVTGVNNVLGRPFFSWGDPYGSFGFPTVATYNESGEQPLPITENTPDSALLATVVDANLLVVNGKDPDYEVPPEWINVPLRDVPVNVDFAFENKEALRGEFSANKLEPAQAEPASDITLGQWMQATGVAQIVCNNDGADIRLRMRSLIPNRMYAVWATLGLPSDGSVTTFFPIPIGGTPNMFITDENGDADFERNVTFCPFDTESTLRPLLTLNVVYHANHQNYGAVPEPGFVDGLWLGMVTFNHIQFPVNVEVLDY